MSFQTLSKLDISTKGFLPLEIDEVSKVIWNSHKLMIKADRDTTEFYQNYSKIYRQPYYAKIDQTVFFLIRSIILKGKDTLILSQVFVDLGTLLDCVMTYRSILLFPRILNDNVLMGIPSYKLAEFFQSMKEWHKKCQESYLRFSEDVSDSTENRVIKKRKYDSLSSDLLITKSRKIYQ